MVGFATIGEAVANILRHPPGWFTERYEAMLSESAEEGADGDCVFQLILMLLANGDGRPLRATSGELLESLHQHMVNRVINVSAVDLPRNPRAMTARVNRVAEPLRKFRGIEIAKRGREWIMSPAAVARDEDMERAFASVNPPF